jgi:MOSC domain-containing protein YiiM
MPEVIAVCMSEHKGTRKTPVDVGVLKIATGLIGDAHAGSPPQREVSLLAIESIQKMNAQGYAFKAGDFAENLTTEGLNLPVLPIGTRLQVGDEVVLEITQIGKKCHTKCAIYQDVGKCIMPKEGVFGKVISGGSVKAGDKIKILTAG